MTTEQAGENAIGVLSVSNFPQEDIFLISKFDIYLAFDNDEAGSKAVSKIAPLFNKPLKVLKLKKHKDITEFFINEYKDRFLRKP